MVDDELLPRIAVELEFVAGYLWQECDNHAK